MTMGAKSGSAGDDLSQPNSPPVVVAASIMALDTVNLEESKLALYSVYIAHIG